MLATKTYTRLNQVQQDKPDDKESHYISGLDIDSLTHYRYNQQTIKGWSKLLNALP
jgi:hypothetical protein